MNDTGAHCAAGPYYVDCISETVEENHFIVKVITMDVDWDGLIPADRAGTKVQYSIASQTRAVSGHAIVYMYSTCLILHMCAYYLALTMFGNPKVQLLDRHCTTHSDTDVHCRGSGLCTHHCCTLIMLHRTLGDCYNCFSFSPQGTFVINADTGVITVANSTLLDREQYAAEHLITVEATDGDHV